MQSFTYGRRFAALLLSLGALATAPLACSVRVATIGDHGGANGPSGSNDVPYGGSSSSSNGATGYAGTGGSGGSGTSGASNGTCDPRDVVRARELLVRDPRITGGAYADNTVDGAPLSFRHVMTSMAGGEAQASAFTRAWLDAWKTRTLDGTTYGALVVPRPAVDSVLVCPWLRARPENGCDDACGSCRERVFDMRKAPFRLTAVVSRIDLGVSEGACGGIGATPESAELRLVFTATRQGSDDALPFSVIAEYGLGAHSRDDLARLARELHAIAAVSSDDAYARAFGGFVAPRVEASSLRQLRTNEVALGEASGLPWELREFHLAREGGGGPGAARLVPVPLARTPDIALDGSPALTQWLDANDDDVTRGASWSLPAGLQAATAWVPNASFAWTTRDASSDARAAFNRATCNGCHGGLARSPSTATAFQHVVATGGATAISSFLADELERRAAVTARLLCDGAATPQGPTTRDAGSADASPSPPSTPSPPYGGSAR